MGSDSAFRASLSQFKSTLEMCPSAHFFSSPLIFSQILYCIWGENLITIAHSTRRVIAIFKVHWIRSDFWHVFLPLFVLKKCKTLCFTFSPGCIDHVVVNHYQPLPIITIIWKLKWNHIVTLKHKWLICPWKIGEIAQNYTFDRNCLPATCLGQ